MIGDRGRNVKPVPRLIVRRRKELVGEHRPRAIITRERGVVEAARARAVAERPRSVRSRRRLRVPFKLKIAVGGAALVAVLAAGGFWTYQSPLLRIQKVQIEGASQLPADAIVERAGLQGQSMFTADLGRAQQDIARLTLVSSVKIERAWPSTVKVVVTEREPWGTWQQGSVDYVIDRTGVVLGLGEGPQGAPVITSSEQGSRVQGDHVNYQAVDAAAEIYEKLPHALGTSATQVAFVAGKGVQVTTANGQTALLGDSSSIAYKLAVWSAVSREATAQRIEYTTIDLRFGNRPVLQ